MAKDRDRTLNPAAAQRKADKARALKKSKTQLAAQRNEKLARRNPERLQRQIDDLKAAEAAAGGSLRPKDRQTFEQLERDVRAIGKAREALGDAAPKLPSSRTGREGDGGQRGGREGIGGRGGRGGILGKRRRDNPHTDADAGSNTASSDTDPEALTIPMPADVENMPPIPRPRRHRNDNPNHIPLPTDQQRTTPHALPPKPAVPAAQTVYASAPVVRDLRKEATSRFVPAAVAQKIRRAKGEVAGVLVEPEEAERLEGEGYVTTGRRMGVEGEVEVEGFRRREDGDGDGGNDRERGRTEGDGADRLREEERFEREVRRVEMEEVEDEDL